MKKLSIVIPVYNEEQFIQQALTVISSANSMKLEKEIIIVDDGSTDKTPERIKDFITKYTGSVKISTIFKNKNQGKGAALKDGFSKSTGDIVLVQDADLEYNPDDYPIMLEPFLKNAADVVYGSRFISNRPHRVLYFWHYQINLFLTVLSNMLTNLNLTDMETGFKAFKGELIRKIANKLESHRFGFEPEVTARIAKIKELKIYEVGISYSGRTYSEGKKIGWRDGVKALWEIIKYNLLRG
ncbi:glycosyl transferase [Candidatus Daviesbacteria bacterium RIFCSPHIGHO2_02_FULL_36_13]|uniref:Glycosyl transferase n=1 Tax=Candidatus Daviesbacteria bacterium RIFCSPHIGHO2_02_FULL_36_13 TaxID=1797768 RepID=A0A1F5JNT0_9BACT|nr:MAG: glycosyl transferase [Candidatus Daviesbacteria bacterium RIFCSPHIGHO2_02_FULL_36_13]OGE44284.1 MAG: glycosyl transferase [Candidatus Daviesbacteria bacterium RIFCSPLOWO2_01_FULL_36_8]